MSKITVYEKAWLKLSYKEDVYVPVVVLERTSQLRSLIADDVGQIDRKLAYYVDYSALLPRNQQSNINNLLAMKYVNLPELKQCLAQRLSNKDQNKLKYAKIGFNTIVDLQPPQENNNSTHEDQQLIKFYHTQLQMFLSNKKQQQKSVIILSKNNQNPHCYIDPLLQLMSKNNQLWPHKIKIQKLGFILKKLLFNVSLEMKLGFLQNNTNIRQARKVMFVHLKPFLPIQPSQGLVVPQQILSLGNTPQFCQMYKGPIPTEPYTPGSLLQNIVDAFLSLGLQVKQVHSLMRLLSLIMNLQKIQVQKQIEGSPDSKYATFHLKSKGENQNNDNNLDKIKDILQLEEDRLQNLMIFGEYDHVSEMSLKERQKLIYLQQLGNKQQLATFRVHILKYLLYQMFITQACQILNKKLCSQTVTNSADFKPKCFIVFSYGVASKQKPNIHQKQRINSMFWINGRHELENKIYNIVKYNILPSIIGVSYDDKKVQSKLKNDFDSQSKNSKTIGLLSNYNSAQKQPGTLSKKQAQYKNLNTFINYFQSIQNLKKQIQSSSNHKYEYRQAVLVHKQLCLYQLFQQMTHYQILSQISLCIFKNLYRKQMISETPYTFYQYLWPNYQQSQLNKSLKFQSVSSFITNRQILFQQPIFLDRLVDAIHKKQIFMDSQQFQNQLRGSVQLSLMQFANRYLYTQVSKQRIHRKYPKIIEKISKMSNKKNKINAATPYLDHDSAVQNFIMKIQQFIKKQKPKQFNLTNTHSFKKYETNIQILDKQLMEQMELQVQNQLKAVKKIQKQYIVYKNRKLTNNIIYKVARQRQLQRLMRKIYTRARCKIGLKRMMIYSQEKYRKQQQEIRRLKRLQQQLEIQERRKKIQEERQKKRKIRQQQQLKRQQQQRRLQTQRFQQQQKRRKIEQEQRLKQMLKSRVTHSQNQNNPQTNNPTERTPQQSTIIDKLNRTQYPKQVSTRPSENINYNQNSNIPQQQQTQAKPNTNTNTNTNINQSKNNINNQGPSNQPQSNQIKPKQTSNPTQNKPAQLKPTQNNSTYTKPIETKPTQTKPQTKPAQGTKPVEAKPGQTKPTQNKPLQTQPTQNKPTQTRPTQTKPTQSKPLQSRPIQTKPNQQIAQPATHPNKNMQISQTNPTQNNTQRQSNNDPASSKISPDNSNTLNSQPTGMFILDEPKPAQNTNQAQPIFMNNLDQNKTQTQPKQNHPNVGTGQSIPNQQNKDKPKQQQPKYQIKVQPNVVGPKKQQPQVKKQQMKQQQPKMHLLSQPSRKNQNQYIQKSQNIEQLTNDQLLSIQDNPVISLQDWQKHFKLKSQKTNCNGKQVFTKYASMTQRLPGKQFQLPKPSPDQQIIDTFMDQNYLQYVKQNLQCQNTEEFANMLINQKQQLIKPYFKQYPIKKYPTLFRQAFNAILKIGLQKNSSKKLHELLNVFAVPLYESYYAQLTQMKTMFDQSAMIPSDHSSTHNALKDQVFLYFMKQITPLQAQKFPKKNHYAYLNGLSVFTRSFSPSPQFLYPFTQHIYSLHKNAVSQKKQQPYINLLESVLQNLLLFIQANEGFKRNAIHAFVAEQGKPVVLKNETQCAGYIHPRKTPISQFQISKPVQNKKPIPPLLTIWLVNHESFTFPVRSQIVKTIKKKVLAQIGFLYRQNCFSLYFAQPDYSYTLIDQKQKAINLFPLMEMYKQLGKRRPIYLRITHYFPFNLRDINSTRLMYLNMISDEITYPFTAQQYQFLAAQSMAYDDYEQIRIGNYLQFSDQITSKNPNTKPIQQKYKQVVQQASKKVCEFQYLKYMKSIGFLLMKCFHNLKDQELVVGIKPIQIALYKNKKIIASIIMKRVKNVYLSDKKVVIQLYYKGQKQDQERLRTVTLQNFRKSEQLFRCILYFLQNRVSP